MWNVRWEYMQVGRFFLISGWLGRSQNHVAGVRIKMTIQVQTQARTIELWHGGEGMKFVEISL